VTVTSQPPELCHLFGFRSVYLSFRAIQELVSTVQPSKSDFPKGFSTLLLSQVNDLEKVIEGIQLMPKLE